jgi:hypothetical protein
MPEAQAMMVLSEYQKFKTERQEQTRAELLQNDLHLGIGFVSLDPVSSILFKG